jgi:hypothetical protein
MEDMLKLAGLEVDVLEAVIPESNLLEAVMPEPKVPEPATPEYNGLGTEDFAGVLARDFFTGGDILNGSKNPRVPNEKDNIGGT